MKFIPKTPADISNYNQVSVDLIYPESSNISKIKFFSNSGINKDTSIDSSGQQMQETDIRKLQLL